MDYKIRIESPEHSRKVQEHLFSLGYKWGGTNSTDVISIFPETIVFYSTSKKIYYFVAKKCETLLGYQEVELIETVSYELKEIPKKEVVTIGEKSYYKDELEVALKNINPI